AADEDRAQQHGAQDHGEERGGQPCAQRHPTLPARVRSAMLPQVDDHPASGVDPDLVEADVDLAKAALRVRFLAARRALAAPVRATADAAVRAALRAALPPGPVTAAYVPVGAEPGGPELPDVLAATGRRVLLPVLCNDLDLDWAAYSGPGCLVPASRGLREPTGPRPGRPAVASADAVVGPAVA